jgi:plasmid stabilization system protein ParE
MTYHFDILPKAQDELFEAWTWYEEKQVGLGKRFRQVFFSKIELILSSPLQYPVKNKFREAIINDFPYIIVYRVNSSNNIIYIISVFHMNRHPKRKHR